MNNKNLLIGIAIAFSTALGSCGNSNQETPTNQMSSPDSRAVENAEPFDQSKIDQKIKLIDASLVGLEKTVCAMVDGTDIEIYQSAAKGIDRVDDVFEYDISYTVTFYTMSGKILLMEYDLSDRVEGSTADYQKFYFENGELICQTVDYKSYDLLHEGTAPIKVDAYYERVYFVKGEPELRLRREISTTEDKLEDAISKAEFKSVALEADEEIMEKQQKDMAWFVQNALQ